MQQLRSVPLLSGTEAVAAVQSHGQAVLTRGQAVLIRGFAASSDFTAGPRERLAGQVCARSLLW